MAVSTILTLLVTTAFFNIGKCDISCQLDPDFITNVAGYSNIVNDIIKLFTEGEFKGKTYDSLENFTDIFGNRPFGTQVLENAIDYMINKSIEGNFDKVYTENMDAEQWIRGEEYVEMHLPRYKKLPMLGLATSVPTPPEGITAEAIVVKSFEELNTLPDNQINGKIVVYNEPFTTYSETSPYRVKGASAAAKKGAVAALVRSVTPFSIATPHTGTQTYEPGVPQIPVAAITLEDAEMLWRFQKKGFNIKLKLKMSNEIRNATSRNTIAELHGSDKKDDIVLISGHLDSWDVGDGAMDDGAGSFISWMAAIALKFMNLKPMRTIRVVLWTDEEYNMIGSQSYFKQHLNEMDKLKFVMESDNGVFKPRGLIYGGSDEGYCMVREILKLFSSLNATEIRKEDKISSDINQFVQHGIPGVELLSENEKYFWFHHTEADTIQVLDSASLDESAALWTAFVYIVADMKYDIPKNQI